MKRLILLLLVLVLFYSRFVGLDWGLPYPMHPDERNMANAVQGLDCHSTLSECLNPHFFAYGQLPLYLAYGEIELQHYISQTSSPITFNEATIALRTLSALASVLLVFVLYKTFLLFVDKKHIKNYFLRIGAFMLLVFSPFAIQFAHFGTTESLLMLFYSSIFYICMLFFKKKIGTIKFIITTSVLSGLSLGTKTSSVLFIALPIIMVFLKMVGGAGGGDPDGAHIGRSPRSTSGEESRGRIYHFLLILVLFLFLTLVCFCLSSPQSFINWNDFISSMTYESSIGMGKYIPFYTRQFVGTIPFLFQIKNILPYALGWPQFLLGILGIVFLPIKKYGKTYINEHNMLRLALLIALFPSIFFAKWTRFIATAFPFFSLSATLFLYQLLRTKRLLFATAILASIIPGIAFLSVYRAPDVRFTASEWIFKNIPSNSKILSETANVVDLPIPSTSSSNPENKYFQIASFNFYDLDGDPKLQRELPLLIKSADYIIVPSRRIFKNHPKETYPVLNEYYEKLFSGEAGFVKIAEFSSYPKISLLGHTLLEIPDENAEETWSVFDHPVIRIYKRSLAQDTEKPDFTDYKTINYQIKTTNYRLLVADTAQKWEKGLMYVKNKQDIKGLDGMIFTFPDSQMRTFWNKNTLSDLTLYWIEKGKIIGMSSMPSITKTGSIVTFSSPGSADAVIEIVK